MNRWIKNTLLTLVLMGLMVVQVMVGGWLHLDDRTAKGYCFMGLAVILASFAILLGLTCIEGVYELYRQRQINKRKVI